MPDADPTLAQLLDRALMEVWSELPSSRLRQLCSHLTRYAAWLGSRLKDCRPQAYHLSEEDRLVLVEDKGQGYSLSYRKNIRRDVAELLQLAVDRGWLPPLPPRLPDWRTRGEWKAFEQTYYGRMGSADLSAYSLTGYGRRRMLCNEPRVGTPAMRQEIMLRNLAPDLAHELDAYLASCLDAFDPHTPQVVKKVAISVQSVRDTIDRLAGYAVHVERLPAEALDLSALCEPTFLRRFIPWWLARRGRSTGGLRTFLSRARTIAEHWLHDPDRAQEISALYDMPGLPPEQPMDDREPPWLDLEELNILAEARHPLNARRLHDSAYAREVDFYIKHPGERPVRAYRNKPYGTNLHNMAVWVEQSLMLQLLIHRPLRQRNIRELAIRDPKPGEKHWHGIPFAKNLLPQPDGSYRLHFEGKGLKVRMRRGKRRQMHINIWDESFPQSLVPALMAWLDIWRPKLLKNPDYPFLFLSRWGDPYTPTAFSKLIAKTTWIFTQNRPGGPVAINPHRIRSIWWTSMVIAKMDFITLVRMFGDSVSVAMQHYTDIDKARKISQWTRDLAKNIEEGTD